MMKWDLKMSHKITLLFMVLGFMTMACVLPVIPVTQASLVPISTEIINTSTPTPTPSLTPFLEVIDCKNIQTSHIIGYVNASPIGLNLRKVPNGDIIKVIPHQERVEVLSKYDNGWYLLRWTESFNSTYCGYGYSDYIIVK